MGSSSGENEMGISGVMDDRFSSLPDAVAHRILSFIDVDEFGSVMLVSKRLNQLWFSAPCLSMANKGSTGDSSHRAKLDRFFTVHFSRRRQYGAKVEQLSILWSFNQAKPPAVEYDMRERNDCDEDDPVFTCLCRCATYCDLEHVNLNLVLRAGACLKGGKISACNSFVVQCVMSAKSLHLPAKTVQLFYIQCCKTIGVPSLGVETLRIDDFYLTEFEVTGLTFVLKMMPNLKNIHLASDKDFPFKGKASTHQEGSMYTLGYWEEQNLKFVQQLETATVEIHKEKGNATELVKYFAKHGRHLGNLKVICPPAMVSAVSSQIEVVKNTAVNVTYVQMCDALRREC